MKIGFTGTRHGMTDQQTAAVGRLLSEHAPLEFHHGCCVGADDEANTLARRKGVRTIGHRPIDTALMADCECDENRDPLTHFARNRAIVDECAMLIATPYTAEPQPRGGTWYTINYARKRGKPVHVIRPDGTTAR